MKILVSALEASANLHLSHVIKELEKHSKIELCGIFELEGYSGALHKSSEFGAMGFVEVLGLIAKAKRALKKMVELAGSCDTVLLIDSPAFNMPLAKALKKANIKANYYILPQVWAWKEYRAKILAQNCENLLSILPFEREYFGTPCKFVGHPLLDEIKVEKSKQKSGIIAFLPGSRRSEIWRLMPVFRELASKLESRKIIAVPAHLKGKESEYYGDISGFELSYDANSLLAQADFAFICSGTATLQAALIGTPFVLCYKAKAIDVFLARLFVRKLKHIGLANIIFDFLGQAALHAELIQDEVSAAALLAAYKDCDTSAFAKGCLELKKYLSHGASANVAKILLEKSH